MDRSFWILYMFFQSSGEIGRRIRITIPHSFILQVPLKLPPAPASVLASISKRVSPNDTLNPHHRQARPKLSTMLQRKEFHERRGRVKKTLKSEPCNTKTRPSVPPTSVMKFKPPCCNACYAYGSKKTCLATCISLAQSHYPNPRYTYCPSTRHTCNNPTTNHHRLEPPRALKNHPANRTRHNAVRAIVLAPVMPNRRVHPIIHHRDHARAVSQEWPAPRHGIQHAVQPQPPASARRCLLEPFG
jgi:hypothetical protein